MKTNLLIIVLSMVVCMANASDNKALLIGDEGTNFYFSGLDGIMVSDLTIEGWVKLDGSRTFTDYAALVDFRNAAAGDSKALIFKTIGGNLTTSYEWNGNWLYQGPDNIVVADEWHHVAVVISGADAEARFYINGVETGIDNTYSGLGDELPLGDNIRVGAGLAAEPSRTVFGLMDEIRIWTVARTADELYDNMSKEIDPASNGLLMYYRCNEEENSQQLTDATGNGYDLLLADGAGYYEFVDDTEWNSDVNSVRLANSPITISTYPNPVKDRLFFKSTDFQSVTIDILDVTGRLIGRKVTESSSIDVSNLIPGMYFIHINEGSKMYHAKFIKE